jgi:ubiquinone/menaquinone biosynthesis C-methylase UbiE
MTFMLELPLIAYGAARAACYTFEFTALNLLSVLLPSGGRPGRESGSATRAAIRKEILALLRRDSEHIARGIYPLTVLTPESPLAHALRIPRILADGIAIYRRRKRRTIDEFDARARDFLDELPPYYRRNFHFQTGGYLTDESARLYDHQVEMLFSGAADAMRRLVLPPLRERFGACDGSGLSFLEIGAGTGSATRFVRLAFPKAKITALDLSDPYLREARRRLARHSRIDYVQGDGGRLPFQAGQFDAVYSVFLFHELPLEARKAVLAESMRVLKPGGFTGFVDSLQTNDNAAFNKLLVEFPRDYHEPFYANYISHPMERLIEEAGFLDVNTGYGFFSKVCWASR